MNNGAELKLRNDADTSNAIGQLTHEMAVEYLNRSRMGASASMNGALDYHGMEICRKLRELGWKAPYDPDA